MYKIKNLVPVEAEMKTYRELLIETNKTVRAALATGGKLAFQTEIAIQIATGLDMFLRNRNEFGYQQQLSAYLRYCDRIGFDPIP